MKISDEAVHAALNAWRWKSATDGNPVEEMRRAITAALPHLQSGYAVKQLEWERTPAGNYRANSEFCTYIVSPDSWTESRKAYLYYDYGAIDAEYPSITEAKAAAQADFERRVRERIIGGVDVTEVRRQALREALQAITDLPTPYSLETKDGREDCCNAIRALSNAPTTEAGK